MFHTLQNAFAALGSFAPPALVAVLVAGVFYVLWAWRARRVHAEVLATLEDIAALGEVVPDTIHPVIDLDRCIGSGACVTACPEKQVLGVVHGQAVLLNPLACVGHGACVEACPVDAIKLVFGTATKGVELPRLDPNFQTTRAGVYVIGELGGMGLIRNAVLQGTQAAAHVVESGRHGKDGAYDAVVVGAGPAGVAATLKLMQAGQRVLCLERSGLGGTIMHYPRAKVVMTGVLELPMVGAVKRTTMSKEELLELWDSIAKKANLPVKTGVSVESISAESEDTWRLNTSTGPVQAANVLLALGRRGNPRKLDVPGEEQTKVSYGLIEPQPFEGKNVLVVGGGNSAVETALALADFGKCASVAISYRRSAFARCRAENRRRIDAAIAAQTVHPLMPSEVKEINERDVVIKTDKGPVRLENDAVIIQIGGTAPAELLKTFGIEVVTKHGEA